MQFVPFDRKAWHAGESSFQGVGNCNDFSIGVELEGLGRILVPIKDLSASAREQFELALRVINSAPEDQRVRITLLHVHDPRFSGQDRHWMEQQLIRWRPPGIPEERFHIVIVRGPGIDGAIHRLSREHDLVILRTQRRRVAGLPIPGSDRTSQLIRQLHLLLLFAPVPVSLTYRSNHFQ